jgi:hypothetical protein
LDNIDINVRTRGEVVDWRRFANLPARLGIFSPVKIHLAQCQRMWGKMWDGQAAVGK